MSPSYTVGRVAIGVARPLALLLANNFLPHAVTLDLAIALLATSLTLVAVAADPHRRFYEARFGRLGTRHAEYISFHHYAAKVGLLATGGTALIATTLLLHGQPWLLALTAGAYFFSEKVADEALRLRLFQRDYAGWGHAAGVKSAGQLCFIGLSVAVAPNHTTAPIFLAWLTIPNLMVFHATLLPLLRRWRNSSGRLRRTALPRAVRALAARWDYWAISLALGASGYLDRLVTGSLDPNLLPTVMLAVTATATLQMVVDFYYISARRADFLRRQVSVKGAFAEARFLRAFGAGMVVAAVAMLGVMTLADNATSIPFAALLYIASFQVSSTLASVPQQILYWGPTPMHLLRVETIYWAVCITLMLAGNFNLTTASGTLSLASIAAVGRMLVYVLLAHAEHSEARQR